MISSLNNLVESNNNDELVVTAISDLLQNLLELINTAEQSNANN